jgi:SOS-response transcriptional repressor LexA
MKTLSKKELLINSNDFDRCRIVVRELLYKNNINVTELAKSINLPQPTIQRLVTGKTSDPKLSTLTLIANYFSITIDQLLGNTPIENISTNHSYKIHTAPIVSWKTAIGIKDFFDSTEIKNWKDWISIDIESSQFSFGLRTKPSMEPRFINGSILTIDPNKKPVDGDLIIVHYVNTEEATIRELILDGPKHAIRSITDQSIEELTENIKVIGVVIQTRFSY